MALSEIFRREAEEKRLELLLGLTTQEDVVAWADETIDRVDTPPRLLYDLSLAGHLTESDMAAMLKRLAGRGQAVELHAAAFRRFSDHLRRSVESGKVSAEEAAGKLCYAAFRTGLRLPEKVALACDMFDDEFGLVKQGVLDREVIEKELVQFLIVCSGDQMFIPAGAAEMPEAPSTPDDSQEAP